MFEFCVFARCLCFFVVLVLLVLLVLLAILWLLVVLRFVLLVLFFLLFFFHCCSCSSSCDPYDPEMKPRSTPAAFLARAASHDVPVFAALLYASRMPTCRAFLESCCQTSDIPRPKSHPPWPGGKCVISGP